MSMKAGGETWSLISDVLGKSKQKVQQRYKKLVRKHGAMYGSSSEDDESEVQKQLHIQQQIRDNLHPPRLSFEHNDYFTKRDCKVLAKVDNKMKRGKLLEMQANFLNATGRLVPVSVFRDKCEAAEARQRALAREVKISA